MNATDRLRQAAQKLRDTGGDATPGPWTYDESHPRAIYTAAPIDIDEADWGGDALTGYRLGAIEDPNAWRYADVRYIALMAPPVALAVADWLEDIAADKDSGLGSIHPRALDVTNLILGGDQ